ncbi:MAG: DNRLRE domain-containing protein, partial [bacterium]
TQPGAGTVSPNIGVVVEASDPDGSISEVDLYINSTHVRTESNAPYEWGTANNTADDPLLLNCAPGVYQLRAVATDNDGDSTSVTLSVTVEEEGSDSRIRADHTLTAVEDAYVRKNAANKNFGEIKRIKVKSNSTSEMRALLKFEVPDISDKIVKAALKIYVINTTDKSPKIYKTSNNWSENSVTWDSKPGLTDSKASNPGPLSKNWQTIDVTSLVDKKSTLSLILIPASSDGLTFKSKESSKKAPQLIIETDADNGGSDDNNDGGDDNNGAGHFTTTSGTTDLNYADAVAFATEYKKLGHTHDKYVRKITKNGLKNILAANRLFNYHSGHGDEGGLIMCTDGNLFASDLENSVQVQYSIFATCITLKTKDWYYALGSNAKMVMGFTKIIWDDSALTMAKEFNKHLSNGETYLQAWYKTNSTMKDHQDRWATYVKEGSKVVLYSAASGNIPRYSLNGTPVVLSDQVTVDNILLNEWNNTITFDRSFQVPVVEEMAIPLERNLLERNLLQDTWPTNRSYITAEEAKTIALNALDNYSKLPDGAELDAVIPIQKCDSSNVCFTVAYQVYFTQQYNGLNLRSNSMADYVSVLVNDNGIVSTDLTWSQVTPLDDTILERSTMLTVGKALATAAESISDVSREPVNIVTYETVYGISTDVDDERTLVPAYEFIGNDGERFVVSAVTGKLLY